VKSLIHCATESDPLDMTDLTTTEMPTKPKKTGVMSLPWELIASLIGVVSGLSLFLSILFDMGYFETLGLRFVDIPSTISDHVRSALLWVPQATTSALTYVMVVLFQEHFGGLLAKEGVSLSKKQASLLSRIGDLVYRTMIAAAFVVVIANYFTGGVFVKYEPFASTITIAYLVFTGAKHLSSRSSLSPAKIVLLCLFPIITFFVYNYGRTKAIEDRLTPRIATITLDGQREIQLNVYRYLDRGVLGVEREGKLVFYRWEEVKKLNLSPNCGHQRNLFLGCSPSAIDHS
jgi:hypothetical protein